MRSRLLGRTGLTVSEIAIGTARLAAPDSDPAEARATIAMALDRGVDTFEIDAGDHEAAALLGRVLKAEGATQRVHILARVSPRVPLDLPSPHLHADEVYPGSHIRAGTDALLASLGVERLAIQQLHMWCPEWLGEGDWLATFEALRTEGKIAGFGVSLFDHDVDAGLTVVASGEIDTVQVMYNLFDQGAAEALFPNSQRHDVGVIARAPFYYGPLAGPGRNYTKKDWRTGYFYDEHAAETRERADRLAEIGPAPALALRFSLSHPAISTVATGIRTRAQLEADLAALEQGSLDPDTRAALARHAWLC